MLDAYKDAFRGLAGIFIERSLRQMLFMAALVLVAMFYFPTSGAEKALLIFMISIVLGMELVNSVIERIMDFVHPEHHEKVGEIKDIMAGVVLLISIGAAIVGGIIFLPYIRATLRS